VVVAVVDGHAAETFGDTGVRFQNSATVADLQFSGCAFVLVDQSSQYRSASDPVVVTVRGGVIGARRDTLQCSVRPAAVVVGAVLAEDGPQVPFAEDQDAVGEFGPDGQDEAFGEAVRSRTSRRNLHDIYAGAGQGCVERGGELAAGCNCRRQCSRRFGRLRRAPEIVAATGPG
jgi:hypothetical protein